MLRAVGRSLRLECRLACPQTRSIRSWALPASQLTRPSHALRCHNGLPVALGCRFGAGISSDDLRKRLLDFNEQFGEARLCMDEARESKDTTYFKDDIEEALEALEETEKIYNSLLADLDEKTRTEID